jgi:hypothetical protein
MKDYMKIFISEKEKLRAMFLTTGVPVCLNYMKIFISEKEKLRAMFLTTGARVYLIIDMWTSMQNLNYMCIICYFIDGDWNLHKRIINFSLIPNHK